MSSAETTPGQPFALRVEGRLKLRRSDQPAVVYEASEVATSEAALTIDEWGANGAEALRRGLDQTLRQLADELLSDLARGGAPLPSLTPVSLNEQAELF